METFTLLWGGVPTKPIPVSANETEVCSRTYFTKCTWSKILRMLKMLCDKQVHSALEEMMSGECPTEILKSEGTKVAYFNNFENAPQVGGGGGDGD